MKKTQIYLDYAAATPLDPVVQQAMHTAEAYYANPASQYEAGRIAQHQLEQARKQIAHLLGSTHEELILTSGATEANNLAILGAARAVGHGHIIALATEHASVREPINQLAKEGFTISWCPTDHYGQIKLDEFVQLLRSDTILVSVQYASSEVGTIQPIRKIAQLIQDFQKAQSAQIVFHTDASAAATLLNCDVSRLGVDLLTLSASKLYGPKGIGALYRRRGTLLKPLLYGGGQGNGLRSGSESIALATGFAAATKLVDQQREQDEKHYAALSALLNQALHKAGQGELSGHPKHRLQAIASYTFDGINGEDLVAYLDAAGFAAATGAACEAGNGLPSHALLAMGYSRTQAQGSLRVSWGRATTEQQVTEFATALTKVLKTLGAKRV